MDKLVAETEGEKQAQIAKDSTEVSEKKENKTQENQTKQENIFVKEKPPAFSQYVSSFENMTVADIKREEEKKQAEAFKKEKKELIEKQFKPAIQEEKQQTIKTAATVIEKPNYDLLEENKKIVKLKKQTKQKKAKNKKLAGVLMAVVLGGAAIACVANVAILENYSANFAQLENEYNLKLGKYLKDLTQLDTTKKGMEFLETYPEDLLDAGDLGQKSNWFDRLCNFLGGIFGG